MTGLLLIAASTLISEDLASIGAGLLVAQGKLELFPAIAACFVGIYFGDLGLYVIGRIAGRPALRWRWVRRFLSEERVDRASEWLAARGPMVVLISRFTPGLRLPAYFAAGLLKTNFWTFAGWFFFAAILWTPLLVGLAAAFGDQTPLRAAIVGLALLILTRISPRRLRWEFWPPWLAYLPVCVYVAWLAFRNRSLTIFTAANPGFPSGGFAGESKFAILSALGDAAAACRLIPAGEIPEPPARYPVVLKPDAGERGDGVAVIRSDAQFREYLAAAATDSILQAHVGGIEFGVFYVRHPREDRGHIHAITEKVIPPPLEIGSHCRGARFFDGTKHKTAALENAIDLVSRRVPEFYFGRYDVRSESIEAFQAGKFTVLELNGVTSEPTHIYDPRISVWGAYRELFWQWRTVFEFGAINTRRGFQPDKFSEVVRRTIHHLRTKRRPAPARNRPEDRASLQSPPTPEPGRP